MSNFFEMFAPGMRHWREQQDLDKVIVVDPAQGGTGPRPLDLDSGAVTLHLPRATSTPKPEPAAEAGRQAVTDRSGAAPTRRTSNSPS